MTVLSSAAPDPSATLAEQAAWWVVQLGEQDPPPPALAEACRCWCDADPRHAEAYAGIARMWSAMAVDEGADRPAPPRRPARGRRGGVRAGLAALLLGVLGWQLPWGVWTADERTAPTERRSLVLADGSRLLLAGGTAIDIEFDTHGRVVRLRRGEVFAEVAADPGRPFRILTPEGSVQALGTRYAVRLDAGGSRVGVEESRVEVRPRAAGAPAVVVSAGQATRFDAARVEAPTPLAPNAWAWRDGRLVFSDVPVAEVLHELARHRSGWLVADDRALDGIRFTGVLPADEPEEALALLNDALPLHVVRLTRFAVHVGRRGS